MANKTNAALTEIELKLRVNAPDLPRLLALLKRLAKNKPPQKLKLLSLYFDTPQLHLLQAGAALRLRRLGRRRIQTLKGGGVVQGGLHQREETEWPVAGPVPDPSRLAEAPGALPWQELCPQLREIFHTAFTRRQWLLAYHGSRIEVALDQGQVLAGRRRETILELELELKSGEALALFDLALELAAQVLLVPDSVSKAERGYRLHHTVALTPSKASAVALQPTLTVEQAFIASVWNCLEQVQRNQRGVAEQQDAEFVHQMRVGLRRLRALLRLFAPRLPEASWRNWMASLRALAQVLGAARDWDVLSLETLPQFAKSRRQSLQMLPQRIRAQSRKAQRAASAAVTVPAYGVLMLELARWLQARAWRADMTPRQLKKLDAPIPRLARQSLRQRHEHLRERGRHFARLSDAQLHRLRIRAKQQRYAVEFLQALYPKAGTRRYHAALVALQDVLGQRNDTLNAQRLLSALCTKARDPLCRRESQRLQAWLQARLAQQHDLLPDAWKEMRRQAPFWR